MNVFIFLTLQTVAMTSAQSITYHSSSCYCLSEELSGLRMPVHVEPVKGDKSYLIAQQIGIILKYTPGRPDPDKVTTYINITDRVVCESKLYEERGLLGFAIHPDFASNKKVYLYSVRMYNRKEHVVITEITNQDVLQEKVLLAIEQPGSQRNGGQLLFGYDGYLYIFVGDGGPDEHDKTEAQDGNSLLGKILRIDVDRIEVEDYRPRLYGVPSTNPLKQGWRPEIYAIGVRNMWRCSVDKGDKDGRGKGRIFCGDLGSNLAEEINIIKKGGNYGWHYREGTTCINPTKCASIENEVFPIITLNRSSSPINAVVGGPMYRGAAFPDVAGHLLYGDFLTADLHKLKEEGGDKWTTSAFSPCDHQTCGCNARAYRRSNLLSFGQTEKDEVLLLMTDDINPASPRGALLKLVPPIGDKPVKCTGYSQRGDIDIAILLKFPHTEGVHSNLLAAPWVTAVPVIGLCIYMWDFVYSGIF